MKLVVILVGAAVSAVLPGSASAQAIMQMEPCEGPFRQCALSISATCSRDSDGAQRITFKDIGGKLTQFNVCVGRVYETQGLPNPMKTGQISDALPFPRFEAIEPNYGSMD
jgi:hypothetical protein